MRFAQPVVVSLDGSEVVVESVAQARDVLIERWPGERGPRHRDALDACLKVLDGHRSTEDAQTAFLAAAKEAKLLPAD